MSRLELGTVLGRGGFGTVHRARLHGEGLSREVAVKLLRPEFASDGDVARRLRDEARMLAHVRHRAIVRVEDLVDLGGSWGLVMELVVGEPLSGLIGRGPLPAGPALDIVRELASALDTAFHAEGPDGPLQLLHRDVKPHNVLVTAAGEVKLLDFGIARAALRDREAHTTTLLYGTPEYMAPERFDGTELPAGDVYGLGCTLLEALTGVAPVRTSARPERHAELWAGWLEAVAATGADSEVVALVGACLEHEPDARPSARELASRCGELLYAATPLADWCAGRVEVQAPTAAPELRSAPSLAPVGQTAVPETSPIEPSRSPYALVGLVLLVAVALTWWSLGGEEPARVGPSTAVVELPEVEPAEPEADPEPVAAAEPAPEPLAAPPPAPMAQVSVAGDASTATLRSGDDSYTVPGEVPPGRYTVDAVFGEDGEMACGVVTLEPGPVTIATNAAFTSCTVP